MGHGISLAFVLAGLISAAVSHVLFKRENNRRDRGGRDEVIIGLENEKGNAKNGCFESVDEAKMRKGDKFSGFRYMV